jgi:uncharacterized membrane protein
MHARLAVAALATVACAHGRPATPRPSPPAPVVAPAPTAFHATIRWTAHGVPHIVAADVGGLGFGQGYAQAKAHLCELADGFVRVRGERARFLGRGPGDAHVTSDLAHLHLGYLSRARAMLPTASAETRAMLAGFAAGYTLALARTPVAEQPVACRGAAWLVPITAVDVAAYGLSLQGLASSRFLAPAIAAASRAPAPASPLAAADRRAAAGASNAWGHRRRSHRQRRRPPGRQPALPVAGRSALPRGPPDHPRRPRRLRRGADRHARDPDRRHAAPRVEPHLLGRDPHGDLSGRARSEPTAALPPRRRHPRDRAEPLPDRGARRRRRRSRPAATPATAARSGR